MTITLTGTYGTADEATPEGYVHIQPMVTAARLTTIITQAPVRADLLDGAFTVDIIASDDPGWSSGPIPYVFTERINGQSAQWMAYVNGPGPVDMSELTPLVEAPPIPEGTDHGTLTGLGDNDHQQYLNRYADAGAPGGYLEILPDGSVHDPVFKGVVGVPTLPGNTDGDYAASVGYVTAAIADALEALVAEWGGGIS